MDNIGRYSESEVIWEKYLAGKGGTKKNGGEIDWFGRGVEVAF